MELTRYDVWKLTGKQNEYGEQALVIFGQEVKNVAKQTEVKSWGSN